MSTAAVLTSTMDMSREDWLEARKIGLGGSDVAKVLGLSKWGGPLTVYMDKMGITPPHEAGEAAYWGIQMEDIVAKEFARRTGKKIRRQNKIFRHPEYPWMIANVDRVIVGVNQGLECKTASAYLAQDWEGDNLPDAYYCQVQHYISVMGWESCWIAALVGGNAFGYKEVTRNDEFITDMIEAEATFWHECIEAGTPPEFSIGDDPGSLFPSQETEELLLPPLEAFDVAEGLLKVKEDLKILEEKKSLMEGRLKAIVKEAQGIEGICTWKETRGAPKWKDIAMSLGATEEAIEATRGTHRRFKLTFKGRT